MTAPTTERLPTERVRELREAATPGPWDAGAVNVYATAGCPRHCVGGCPTARVPCACVIVTASASDRDRLLIAAAPDLAADLLDARQERDALAAALRTERAAREAAEAREHRHSEALRVRDEAIADIAEALGLDADTPTAPIAQVAAAAVARADAADARSATLLMCGEAAERAATEAHAQHAALAGAVRAYLDADRDWRRSRYMIAEHINAAAVENTERLSVERYAAWAALDALLRGAPCGYVPAAAVRAYLAAVEAARVEPDPPRRAPDGSVIVDVAVRAARAALDAALARCP